MIKKIDDYYLNMPVRESYNLKELSLEEYKMFESAGIKRVFRDERIYRGKNVHFVDAVWNVTISATVGTIYKISLQNICTERNESNQVFKVAYDYLFKEMGKHGEYNPATKRYVWDTSEGNVILDQATSMGEYGVQVFLTSNMAAKQQPDKFAQVYEAYKASEKIFRTYTTSLSSYPIIISIVMLFLALLKMPYNYYMLMRLVVCGTAIYVSYKAKNLNMNNWMWIMGFIALLFNPIRPVYLHKSAWSLIDLAVGILFIVFLVRSKKLIKLR